MKKISIMLILILLILSSCATTKKSCSVKPNHNPKPKRLNETSKLPHASCWSYTG